MNEYTCTLAEIGPGQIGRVGGKGANLGELARAGLPVPLAFCVTTSAYRQMVEGNALPAAFAKILEGIDYRNAADLEHRAKAIRALILQSDIPAEIREAVREAHATLEQQIGKDALVSVRSSATAEDLPGNSFAGQQDTYLNISGYENVLQHVARCWASLWTDRAMAYRHNQGFRHEDVLLAVVVQQMFPSEVSGVLFTANPVTSDTSEILLNASWGLGEAIVSGRVNPDQYIIDKRTLVIKDRKIHEKKLMTVRIKGGQGSEEVEVPVADRLLAALPDDPVKELCRIARRIEEHYGFPQDIEWGYAAGRFAILQAREVTGANIDFSEALESWQAPEALATLTDERWVWSRAYSDEVQTGPSSPAFYTDIQPRTTTKRVNAMLFTQTPECLGYRPDQFRHIPYFRWYGARAYYNLAWEKERIRMFIPPFARDDAALWPFPVEEREGIRNMPFNWVRFTWTVLKLHVTNPKRSLLWSTEHLYDNFERWTDNEEALWNSIDVERATPREIFAIQRKVASESGFHANITLPFTIYLYMLSAALQKLLAAWCGDGDMQLYNRLVAGLHTKTSEENLAVWALSRTIKRSSVLMALFQRNDVGEIYRALDESEDGRGLKVELNAFIKKYGHRGAAERDFVYPRWRHKPEMVFHSIRPMLALGDADDPRANEDRLHKRMLETKAECVKTVRSKPFGVFRAPILRWFIELTQDYFFYRDFERFYNDKTMARPRDLYLAIARQFIQRGLLKNEDDLFFLGKDEVVAVDEGKLSPRDMELRIRSRRGVYDKYTNKEPPKYIRGWQTFDDDRLPDDGKGLRGLAASSGTVTGRARVCRKLEEISKIEKGDILVTVATDPAWTTVFSIIGGVVVETGGVVAHTVMISREYGLPCVANLAQACDLIADGATITVDGSSGRVVIHDHV